MWIIVLKKYTSIFNNQIIFKKYTIYICEIIRNNKKIYIHINYI